MDTLIYALLSVSIALSCVSIALNLRNLKK